MKRLSSAITLVVLMLSGAAFGGDRPATIGEFFEPGTRMRVIAHRGFSGRAPENTLAAIREAIAIGADMAEIDVTLSSDREIVVIHDQTLERTTDGSGQVSQYSLTDLQNLDAGSWFDTLFAGERIPTLEEVFATVKGKILLNIEIKSEAVERGITAKVVSAVHRHNMKDYVVISSFSPTALEEVHSLAPAFTTAVLYNSDIHQGLDAVDIVEELGASAFNIKRTRLTSTMMARCREHAIPVGIYTVNKKRHMRRMIKKGVGAVFTDHPDRLIKVLQKHAPPAPTLAFE
jgi:glycerophosphoryl diester phosphodiesterase